MRTLTSLAAFLFGLVTVLAIQTPSLYQSYATQPAAAVLAQVTDDTPATAVAASVYCPQLSTTLQKGSRDASYGGQVSELQSFLTSYYNLDENILVGGYFGNLTQKYTVQFQTEQGLPSFGIVGSLTRAAIAKVCKVSTTTSTVVVPVTAVATSTAPTLYSVVDIMGFMSSGAAKKCALASQSIGGFIYIANNKIAVVGTQGSHLLINGSTEYVWVGNAAISKIPFSSSDFIRTTKEYTCADWAPDTSLFQLPTSTTTSTGNTTTQSSSATIAMNYPVNNTTVYYKSDMPVTWTITPMTHDVRVEITTKLVTAASFSSGSVSGGTYLQTMHAGAATGSYTIQWGLNQTVPGTYSVSLKLEECDPAGCQYYYGPTPTLATTNPITITVGTDGSQTVTTPTTSTNSTSPSIMVTSPTSGQQFSTSGTATFSWSSLNLPVGATVNLVGINTTQNSAYGIATNVPASSGSYSLNIATSKLFAGNYTFLVQVFNANGNFVVQSDNKTSFSIGSPSEVTSVKVLSPNGGESYSIGSQNPMTVSWNATNIPANTTACVTLQSADNHTYNFPAWPASCVVAQNGSGSVSGTFSTLFVPGKYVAYVRILNAPDGSGKDAATLAQDGSDTPFTLTQ